MTKFAGAPRGPTVMYMRMPTRLTRFTPPAAAVCADTSAHTTPVRSPNDAFLGIAIVTVSNALPPVGTRSVSRPTEVQPESSLPRCAAAKLNLPLRTLAAAG